MTNLRRVRSLSIAFVLVALVGCAGRTEPVTVARVGPLPSIGRPSPQLPQAAKPLRFASIGQAVGYIQAHLDIPVVVPAPLPEGTRLSTRPVIVLRYEGRVRAQLGLRYGASGQITLQYGVAGFDGCGGDSAVPAMVGDQPAMLNAHDSGSMPYATVIWPATPDHMQGRYGISATVAADEILAMAESMEKARVAALEGPDPGC